MPRGYLVEGDSQTLPLKNVSKVSLTKSNNIIKEQIAKARDTNLNPDYMEVYITGNVIKPGAVILPNGTGLNQAIATTGGKKIFSGNIEFLRFNREGELNKRIFTYNKLSSINTYNNPVLESGDIIHVKRTTLGVTTFAQIEMKSVLKNTKLNERFRSSENVEKALVEEVNFNFLYEDENNYFFMSPKTFEQIEIKKIIIGEKGRLLTENLEVVVSFYNENPISIELPNQVRCVIDKTDVALKGQTVSSSYKPAVLENGLNIQVPPFIETGDEIVIDTRNLEYVKKI